jgi:hypothetical protein
MCLLDVLKNDFGEVDEVMFEGVVRQYELIFCTQSIEKSDLDGTLLKFEACELP